MNKLLWIAALPLTSLFSCNMPGKRVNGNGNVKTETRSILPGKNIQVAGDYEVELVQDAVASVTIMAEENLLPHILTKNDNGRFLLTTEEGFRLNPRNRIRISVHTPVLELLDITGSSTVNGKGKFTSGEQLAVDITGSGKVSLAVNTPSVDLDISGSGRITLVGETRTVKVDISGSGDFIGEGLQAEEAEVGIAGSGNARVFADSKLQSNITGSGHVYYKGKAASTSNITGSGFVKQLE